MEPASLLLSFISDLTSAPSLQTASTPSTSSFPLPLPLSTLPYPSSTRVCLLARELLFARRWLPPLLPPPLVAPCMVSSSFLLPASILTRSKLTYLYSSLPTLFSPHPVYSSSCYRDDVRSLERDRHGQGFEGKAVGSLRARSYSQGCLYFKVSPRRLAICISGGWEEGTNGAKEGIVQRTKVELVSLPCLVVWWRIHPIRDGWTHRTDLWKAPEPNSSIKSRLFLVFVSLKADLPHLPSSLLSLPSFFSSVLFSSPNLLPNSKTDHSLFIQDPQQTARASKWADPSEHIQAIEVQPGLIGWALDDASEESKSMIVGILRKDDVDEDDEEGSDSEVEEWLEVRMRLVKVSWETRRRREGDDERERTTTSEGTYRLFSFSLPSFSSPQAEPISHAQHLSQLSAFQQGLPFTSPPKRASASSSALAAAAPLPSSRPSHSSSLRDHPTPPTSAPASEPTPSHSLPPPPPQVFRPSPPPSSAQQQPFASTSSFHHPESEAHPAPEGPRAPKRPRVSKAATPAPEPELPKRETRRSTAKAAAAAASTPAGNDDNNGPSSSTTTKSGHPSSTPARGPPTSTPAPASSSGTNPQSTAELLSHTRSLINTTSSSGPSNSNGAGSSFSPQLLELLSKLGKDPSLTADKETVGILTSLLKAAEKEGKQQQETKGGKGKGKENLNSNPKTDAQLVKPPGGFRGTKRKPTGMSNLVDDGTGCSTCGRLKSNTWRAREGGTKVCNGEFDLSPSFSSLFSSSFCVGWSFFLSIRARR